MYNPRRKKINQMDPFSFNNCTFHIPCGLLAICKSSILFLGRNHKGQVPKLFPKSESFRFETCVFGLIVCTFPGPPTLLGVLVGQGCAWAGVFR